MYSTNSSMYGWSPYYNVYNGYNSAVWFGFVDRGRKVGASPTMGTSSTQEGADNEAVSTAITEASSSLKSLDLLPDELLRRARSKLMMQIAIETNKQNLVTKKDIKNAVIPLLPHALEAYKLTYNKNGHIGIYAPLERAAIIAKFKAKRRRREWNKKIRYGYRKDLADARMRVMGRFAKKRLAEQQTVAAVEPARDTLAEQQTVAAVEPARDTLSSALSSNAIIIPALSDDPITVSINNIPIVRGLFGTIITPALSDDPITVPIRFAKKSAEQQIAVADEPAKNILTSASSTKTTITPALSDTPITVPICIPIHEPEETSRFVSEGEDVDIRHVNDPEEGSMATDDTEDTCIICWMGGICEIHI